MHADIARHRDALIALCRRHDVARLEVFGSAARGDDFDPVTSDADFLVTFKPESSLPPLEQFVGFAEALEQLLGRPVDLVERKAIEESRNYLRRRAILGEPGRSMVELAPRDLSLLLEIVIAARDARSWSDWQTQVFGQSPLAYLGNREDTCGTLRLDSSVLSLMVLQPG